MTYRIDDRTSERHGTRVGYLALLLDGKRVCDFFPFADNADEQFIRRQAGLIAETMNGAIAARSVKLSETGISLEHHGPTVPQTCR